METIKTFCQLSYGQQNSMDTDTYVSNTHTHTHILLSGSINLQINTIIARKSKRNSNKNNSKQQHCHRYANGIEIVVRTLNVARTRERICLHINYNTGVSIKMIVSARLCTQKMLARKRDEERERECDNMWTKNAQRPKTF